MKKKPLNNNKDNKRRVKTPDISSIKKKSNKIRTIIIINSII